MPGDEGVLPPGGRAWEGLLPHGLALDWVAYYAVVLLTDVMQAISMAAALWAGAAALRRRWRRPSGPALQVHEPVAVVVPCYLPNEAPIIEGTIRHLMEALTHIDSLTLYVVYNTPHSLPVEAELREMARASEGDARRRLVVQKVEDSTSKAENLNHVIPQISAKYVALYDADHWPDPQSLALAVWHLEDSSVDCVQGSTYIRKGCCLMRLLICAEFFVNYFVALPAMQTVSGTAFFGGANGVWRAASLQQLRFDPQAITEDIDCSARAIVEHGFSFTFLPESCSGELLPAGARALWRQRLRWAMGWDQVAVRHARSFLGAAGLRPRKRAALCYLFFFRWFTQLCAVIIVLFNARTALQWRLAEVTEEDHRVLLVPTSVYHLQLMSFYGYSAFICYAALLALLYAPLVVLPGLVLYFAIMPALVLVNSLLLGVSLVRVACGRTGTWVVTSRAHGLPMVERPSKGSAPGHEPLLGQARATPGALWVLGVGFVAQGAIMGAIVGDVLGQREVVHPLWGWVPFGLGATTTTVTDGRIVAMGMAGGVFLALLFFSLTLLVLRLQGRRG